MTEMLYIKTLKAMIGAVMEVKEGVRSEANTWICEHAHHKKYEYL